MALATWRQHALSRSRSRSSIVLTLGDTGTLAFGHPHRLDFGPARRLTPEGPQITLAAPKLAATGGDVLVAWQRTYPRSRDGVWIGGRLRNGRSMRPRRLGPHGGEPFLSLAPDGSGLLAWRRGRRILARLRTPHGRWGPVETAMTGEPWGLVEGVSLVGDAQRFTIGVVQTHRTSLDVRVRASVHVRVPGAGWRAAVLGDAGYSPPMQTAFMPNELKILPLITSEGRIQVA